MPYKVSVIIPIYNEEKYLSQCLDSVLNQSLRELEIICVDDGSEDSSLAILHAYCEYEPRIKVCTQSNKGPGTARNRGIESAKGEFVSFLDADDCYCENRALEKLYDAAKKNNASVVAGQLLYDIYASTTLKPMRKLLDFSMNGQFVVFVDYQNPLGYQSFIFSRTLLLENDIKFPSLLRYQDPPFLMKALHAAKDIYMLRLPFYVYRVGHRSVDWSFEKVNDLVLGLTDCLVFSSTHTLEILHVKTVSYFDVDYFDLILDSLADGNLELLGLLLNANDAVKSDMLDCSYSPFRLFHLRILQYINSKSTEYCRERIDSAANIVYYGAGRKGKDMISMTKKFQGRFPDVIWDVDAEAIGTVFGQSVSMPDFPALREDWVLILCVADVSVSCHVRLSCEIHGFLNVLDWSELRQAYLHESMSELLRIGTNKS
jgi:glycosyltransferase involved in cell wall biosynthesis